MSDNIEITDESAAAYSDLVPLGAAKVLILPENLSASPPVYAGTTESILKLFRKAGFPSDLAVACPSPGWRDNRSADWFAPTLFVTQLLLTQNPEAVSVALNIVSNYVTDFFKGAASDPTVRMTIVFERGRDSKRIQYKGPASGLGELDQVLKRLSTIERNER